MKEVFVLASSSSSSGNGQARKLLLLRYDDDEAGTATRKKHFARNLLFMGNFSLGASLPLFRYRTSPVPKRYHER